MTEAVEPLHFRSKGQWWTKPRSLRDIAEHLEGIVKDEQNLERKLTELASENSRLAGRCAQVDAELAAMTESMVKLKRRTTGYGRLEAELAMRERLLKDEFERKSQELRLEMNKERRQLEGRVEQLKEELAGCFCRQSSTERVVHVNKRSEPKVARISSRRAP